MAFRLLATSVERPLLPLSGYDPGVMRVACAVVVVLAGCHSAPPASGELTHEQCADMVRHVNQLETDDSSGMRRALDVGLKAGIESCLVKGTERAYRCVLQAEKTADLESCEALMK